MRPRILVADEELFIRELLEEFLTKSGYAVTTASDPHEALRKLQLNEFEAVLVDLRLGFDNGLELLKGVRNASPDTAVLPMTGYPSVNTAREAIRNGAFDYVVKPFKLKELEETVASAVAECQRRIESRQIKERLTELEAKIAAVNVRESKQRLTLKRGPESGDQVEKSANDLIAESDSLNSRLQRIRRRHVEQAADAEIDS